MALNVTAEIILKNESYLIARFSKEESTMEQGGQAETSNAGRQTKAKGKGRVMKKIGRGRRRMEGVKGRRESCFFLLELNDSRVGRARAYEFVCIPRLLDPFMEVET